VEASFIISASFRIWYVGTFAAPERGERETIAKEASHAAR
jgi:hypothetical protein